MSFDKNKKYLPLPAAYHDLKFTQIKVSHVPADSKEVTPTVIVTLYRPKNYNAWTPTMAEELEYVFTLIDIDDRVRCAVMTGDGRMFCAGSDLTVGFNGYNEDSREHRDSGGRAVLAMHRCRKPVIGAINGSAVGIGITMTLPMTIRIAYEGAKIGFVFARRGITMEACSSFFLPRLIGMSKALHLVTTGATYPANHPLLNSLFSETLPKPELVLPRALELADEIVKNTSVISTFLNKEMMYRDTGSAEGQHRLDSRMIYEMFSTVDHQEGVKAFMEKRPVNFQGTMQKDGPLGWPWYAAPETGNRPFPEGYEYKSTKSKL